jgi:hypothetical protein
VPPPYDPADVKFLLAPLAILAFVLFLLVIGAFGLMVSMAVISLFGQIWRGMAGGGRLIGRGGRRVSRRGRRQRS